MTISDDVLAFRRKLGLPVSETPLLLTVDQLHFYIQFIYEEFNELLDAHGSNDLTAAADAVGDLIYLLYGCAHLMGLPIDDILSAIHKANMQKESGTSKRGPGDAVKPTGWQGPEDEIQALLMKAKKQ